MVPILFANLLSWARSTWPKLTFQRRAKLRSRLWLREMWSQISSTLFPHSDLLRGARVNYNTYSREAATLWPTEPLGGGAMARGFLDCWLRRTSLVSKAAEWYTTKGAVGTCLDGKIRNDEGIVRADVLTKKLWHRRGPLIRPMLVPESRQKLGGELLPQLEFLRTSY